jgi:hypothetical protein
MVISKSVKHYWHKYKVVLTYHEYIIDSPTDKSNPVIGVTIIECDAINLSRKEKVIVPAVL